MPDCQLRPATADDAQSVYALICELKQAEFDHQAFHAGFLANLQDRNMILGREFFVTPSDSVAIIAANYVRKSCQLRAASSDLLCSKRFRTSPSLD